MFCECGCVFWEHVYRPSLLTGGGSVTRIRLANIIQLIFKREANDYGDEILTIPMISNIMASTVSL